MSERGGGLSLPGAPAEVPGLPTNFSPVVFEQFATLNTKPLRPGIKDEEMSWCDGWMPVGPNNARILPGTGPSIITTPIPGETVIWFGFGNLVDSQYAYVLFSTGRLVQIDPVALTYTLVLPVGFITSPTSTMGFSQWGSQYILFAKDQVNGYWIWDGANTYGSGSVGPIVTVDADGLGYTSSPTAHIITGGSGTGVALSFTIQNGGVVQGTVTAVGNGFSANDYIVVALSGGGSDNSAWFDPQGGSSSGGLAEVYIQAGGTGYSGYTYATVSGGGGSGATISLGIQNGAITQAAIVSSGSGYTSTPTITVTDPGIPGGGAPIGAGGAVGCNINGGQITGFTLGSGGSGYTTVPIATIVGDGTGATGIVHISGGAVTGITMTNFGSGYTYALVDLNGGNNAAHVTLQLMPYGVSGTWIEVYEGHVWVGNGAAAAAFPPKSRVIFSAPGSPVDFGNGGGAFASTDAFLRVGYHGGKQANGFLYLIGDSSMNYISGVQTTTPSSTTTTPVPTTTFGNLNVDPQIGTPWPSSIQVFSRNIVFANTVGIYVSYGGAVRKISDPLDGFYSNGPIYGPTANFSSAVAEVFGIAVYMLLLPVFDYFLNATVNKLLIWDGKRWFTSQQDRSLIYIATQEINSVLTAWGTDGINIFQLFATPSVDFPKVIQSKLYSAPMYASTKTSRSLSGIANFYHVDNPLQVQIDNEDALGSGNAEVTVPPVGGTGLDVFGPYPIGQQGRLIGITVQTTASDVALVSLFLSDQVYSPNV